MSDSHEHDGHPPGGVGKYWAVFAALCALTVISFLTYGLFHDTPQICWVVMMAVSCTKAMLVITFFMHLKWEANWKYVLTIPASLMAIFLMVTLVPDVGNRTRYYSEERMLYASDPELAPRGHGESHEAAAPEGEKAEKAEH
ncbi:MAG: cytochrome C oxidase subunit IV family protein [Planctomycetota bacterium]